MSSWFKNPFSKKQLAVATGIKEMPPDGKSSVPYPEQMAGALMGYSYLNPPNAKVFDYLEGAANYNPDVANATNALTRLSHTDFYYEAKSGKKLTPASVDIIESCIDRVYPMGSREGLTLSLFRQYSVFGALDYEIEIDLAARQARRLWLLNAKEIRFQWDKEKKDYLPIQIPTTSMTGKSFIPLSPLTFRHLIVEPWIIDQPWGRPPTIAVIDSLLAQANMREGIDFLLKKVGLFLAVLTCKPTQPKSGETIEETQDRWQKELNEKATTLQAGFRNRGLALYEDEKLTIESAVGSTAGIKQLWDLNEEQMASGALVPPAVMGRPYSSTESFASVVYTLFTSQADSAQKLVSVALEHIINLDLALHGINEQIKVWFDPPQSLNPKGDAEAEEIKVRTALSKVAGGIIDIDQAARELGYSQASGIITKPTPGTLSVKRISLSTPREVERLIREYTRGMRGITHDAIRDMTRAVETFLETHTAGDFRTALEFADQCAGVMEAAWSEYDPRWTTVVERSIPEIYTSFLLTDASGIGINFYMSSADTRAIEFATTLDNFLASSLWTGEARDVQLRDWLSERFLRDGEGIFGRISAETRSAFLNEFGEHFGALSENRIDAIISTGTQRIRNWSALSQFHQAGIRTVRVFPAPDCCEVCEPFRDMIVSVEPAYEAMQAQSEMEPETYLNFLRGNNDLIRESVRHEGESLTDWHERARTNLDRMETVGCATPTYHVHCHCELVATTEGLI
jgi:hypothetical protein